MSESQEFSGDDYREPRAALRQAMDGMLVVGVDTDPRTSEETLGEVTLHVHAVNGSKPDVLVRLRLTTTGYEGGERLAVEIEPTTYTGRPFAPTKTVTQAEVPEETRDTSS